MQISRSISNVYHDLIVTQKQENVWNLLRFSKTWEHWISNAAVFFFAVVNHNYDHEHQTLKHRNTQNWSKSTNHKSQTMTFWTRWSKRLCPKKSAKMIDGSEKRERQLALELLQRLLVFEKWSNKLKIRYDNVFSALFTGGFISDNAQSVMTMW